MKKKDKKIIDINKYEQIMYLDDSLVSKILNIMFISTPDNLRKYRIGYNEISLMNMMFIYLRDYHSTNIKEDFYNRFNLVEKEYELEFYIYFIVQYYNLFKDQFTFSPSFIANINDLFYANDIESLYNPDKFKLHYGNAYTDTLSLKEDINPTIINFIKNNLPDNLDGQLEIAIAIYLLLCKVLRYAPIYTITEEFWDTNPYFDVTLKNNEVVCIQFAIIYKKLLDMYGIDANLDGTVNSHMFVNLNIGTLMLKADATRYGYYTDQLELSDLTNLKYDLNITGFYLTRKGYVDVGYVSYGFARVAEAVTSVYEKLGLKNGMKDKLTSYIDKFQKKEFDIYGEVTKEDLDNRVNELNGIFTFTDETIESTQFFNFLIYSMFYDIKDDRVENIPLFKIDEESRAHVTKLLVLYEEDGTPNYYMFYNGKLVNYSVDMVVEIILRDGWMFKRNTDIEALYLEDDEMIKKLMR